jgi:hypothetical protein
MPADVLKFKIVGDGRFKVEIHGDFLDDCGVMHVDDMTPFLEHLKIVAAMLHHVAHSRSRGGKGSTALPQHPRKTKEELELRSLDSVRFGIRRHGLTQPVCVIGIRCGNLESVMLLLTTDLVCRTN